MICEDSKIYFEIFHRVPQKNLFMNQFYEKFKAKPIRFINSQKRRKFTFNIMSRLLLVLFLLFVKLKNPGNLNTFFSISMLNANDDAFKILWTSINVGVSIENISPKFVIFINILVNLARTLPDFCSRSVALKDNYFFIIHSWFLENRNMSEISFTLNFWFWMSTFLSNCSCEICLPSASRKFSFLILKLNHFSLIKKIIIC